MRAKIDSIDPAGASEVRMSYRVETAEHVGEWKVSIRGEALEDVFRAIADVIASVAGQTNDREPGAWETIEVTARDVPTLLVDWANELLGRSEVTGLAYTELRSVRVVPKAEGTQVTADIRGTPVTQWTSPLKGTTYHGLSLERSGNTWHAEVLFDV